MFRSSSRSASDDSIERRNTPARSSRPNERQEETKETRFASVISDAREPVYRAALVASHDDDAIFSPSPMAIRREPISDLPARNYGRRNTRKRFFRAESPSDLTRERARPPGGRDSILLASAWK